MSHSSMQGAGYFFVSSFAAAFRTTKWSHRGSKWVAQLRASVLRNACVILCRRTVLQRDGVSPSVFV